MDYLVYINSFRHAMLPEFRETAPGAGASRAGKVPYPTVLKSTGSQGLPLVSTGRQSTPVLSIRPTLVPLHDPAHTVGHSWYPRRNPQKDYSRAGVFWVDCFPNQTTWTPEFFFHCQYSNSAHMASYWKNDRRRLHIYLQDNPAYCLVVCILIANTEKKKSWEWVHRWSLTTLHLLIYIDIISKQMFLWCEYSIYAAT